MTHFLKNNIKSSDSFYINIYETKNDFAINSDEYLLRQLNNRFSSYISYTFRADFLKYIYSEYEYLDYLELLEVINNRG